MINLDQTYNSLSTGTPVVLKSAFKAEEFAGKRFIAGVLMAVSFGVLSLQAGFVLNANAFGGPISSPISTQQSPAPSASSSTAPITSAVVSPSPSSNTTSNNGGQSSGGNGGGGSSSNSGGSTSAPSCNNEAPKAPKIVAANTTGKSEITLVWEKPQGNVTHYSVSYGLLKGKPLYGNPNVGNVTSFAVKGLSGGVNYYFTVKAVNDCVPSAASNEVVVKVGGKFINSPAQGFKSGAVLSKTVKVTTTPSFAPVASVSPTVVNEVKTGNNAGLVGKFVSLFKGWF